MAPKRGPPNRAKDTESRGNDQPNDGYVRSPPPKKVQPQNQEAAEAEVDSLSRRMAAIEADTADVSADDAIGSPEPPTPSPGPEAMEMEEHVAPPPQPPPGGGPAAPTTPPSGAAAAPPPDGTTAQDQLVIQIKHGSVVRGGQIADELMTKLKDMTGFPDDVFDLFSTKESQYYVGDHKTEMEWGDVLDLLREIVPTSFVLNGADNGLEFVYNQQTAKAFDLDYPGQHFPISIVRSNIEELARVTNIPATPARKSDFNVFKVIVEGAPAPNA